jgi:hypothetical protein
MSLLLISQMDVVHSLYMMNTFIRNNTRLGQSGGQRLTKHLWVSRITLYEWFILESLFFCIPISCSLEYHFGTIQNSNMWKNLILFYMCISLDRLCGLVVRVLGYRSGGPGSIPGTTRKKK